jgi:hypothetical protein
MVRTRSLVCLIILLLTCLPVQAAYKINPFTGQPDNAGSGGSGSSTLDGLTDVTLTSPAKNQALLFNGTQWVNAAQGASFSFSIASFTSTAGATGTTVREGTGNWKAIGAMSFSATYNNGPATGGYVSHSGWSNLNLASYTGPTVNAEAVPYPSVGSTSTFVLHATDGTDSPTSTISYSFYNDRFWGYTTSTSGYTSSDVTGLAGSELSNSKAKTFSSTTGSGQYILWASPTRLGTVTFTVGGFAGGFQAPETVSVTNSAGYTENFYVYRSTNPNLGTVSVVTN